MNSLTLRFVALATCVFCLATTTPASAIGICVPNDAIDGSCTGG